jgi:hypothetical protein
MPVWFTHSYVKRVTRGRRSRGRRTPATASRTCAQRRQVGGPAYRYYLKSVDFYQAPTVAPVKSVGHQKPAARSSGPSPMLMSPTNVERSRAGSSVEETGGSCSRSLLQSRSCGRLGVPCRRRARLPLRVFEAPKREPRSGARSGDEAEATSGGVDASDRRGTII